MNQSDPTSDPPEEPHLRSEWSLLSPTSPKPLHFPQPTNIPVLEMQMDVGFNQAEVHMANPSMHNTDLRPDAWREPNKQQQQYDNPDEAQNGHHYDAASIANASSHLDNPDGTNAMQGETANSHIDMPTITDSMATAAANGYHSSPISLSHGSSLETDLKPLADVMPGASFVDAPPSHASLSSSFPSIFSPEATNSTGTIANTLSNEAMGASPAVDQGDQGKESLLKSNPSAVDMQSLLDTLHTSIAPADLAPNVDALTVIITPSPSQSQASQPIFSGVESTLSPSFPVSESTSTAGLGMPPSGLPPRPPPQDQPSNRPGYAQSQHIQDYHPHATNPAFPSHAHANSNGPTFDPNSSSFVSPVSAVTSQQALGSVGYGYANQQSSSVASNQPVAQSPSGAQPQFPSANTPVDSRRENQSTTGQTSITEDQPWTTDIQRKYDHFMDEERRYVNEARWDQFPQGSRLFVGNLSSEKVTKRDIFHVFHKYGELAQISIKLAYGFVQFLRTEDCMKALEGEQGRNIRDKRIHLEISKPQRNSRPQNTARRSRSPDHGNRGKPSGTVDRYVSSGRTGRERDGYRPGYRSPSPRADRDRYYDRYRNRSRSPSYDRSNRYRGPSPRRDTGDDLPLPRRQPRDVPDVQIVVLDQLDRDFISWVEKAFSTRGVRVDVLLLSPRLSEEAVVRRQIVEGVFAVSKLKRVNQEVGKIGLTIFKRTGGMRDIQFEEYDNLDPNICAELVLREKQTQNQPTFNAGFSGYSGQYSGPPLAPQQPQYGYQQQQQQQQQQLQPPFMPSGYAPPPYGQVPPFASPSGPGSGPIPPQPSHPPPQNLQHLITNMDPNNLQNLLSTLNQASPKTPQTAGSAPYGSPNPMGYQMPPGHAQDPLAALRYNPALANMLAQQQQQQMSPNQQIASPNRQQPPSSTAPGATPSMQDILARLGNYRQ